MAAAYAQAGAIDEAEWEVEQIRILNPDISLLQVYASFLSGTMQTGNIFWKAFTRPECKPGYDVMP